MTALGRLLQPLDWLLYPSDVKRIALQYIQSKSLRERTVFPMPINENLHCKHGRFSVQLCRLHTYSVYSYSNEIYIQHLMYATTPHFHLE